MVANMPPQPPHGVVTLAHKARLVEWALESQRRKLMALPLEHNDWFLAGIAASGSLAGGDAIYAMSKMEPWPLPKGPIGSSRPKVKPIGRAPRLIKGGRSSKSTERRV
jgi:hypothetical protein